jgi:hypothetical protein
VADAYTRSYHQKLQREKQQQREELLKAVDTQKSREDELENDANDDEQEVLQPSITIKLRDQDGVIKLKVYNVSVNLTKNSLPPILD